MFSDSVVCCRGRCRLIVRRIGSRREIDPMRMVRMAGIVTGVYAAAYGLTAAPVSLYLFQHRRLPSVWGLFDMYGGPWSARVSDGVLVALLLAFLVVNLAVALCPDGCSGRVAGAVGC